MAGLIALALAYVLSQFYRSFLPVLTPVLSAEIGADVSTFSLASGLWFALFASMQLVVGLSLDRFGPRLTASVLFGVGASLGALILGLATKPWMFVVAMALMGIGCSPILMAAVFIIAKQFPPLRLAALTSLVMGVGLLGSVFGTTPFAALNIWFGWRSVMIGLSVVTLISAIVLYLFVEDPQKSGPQTGGRGVGLLGYLELFRSRQFVLLLPMVFIATVPGQAIRGLWAGPYLAEVFGAGPLVIGNVTLMMALGIVISTAIYAPLDTLLNTRKWVVVGGLTIAASALLFVGLYADASLFGVTVAMTLVGLAGGYYGLIIAHGKTYMPEHLTGRGVTMLNFVGIGGVGVMQLLTGLLFNTASQHMDAADSYRAVFTFLAFSLIVGLMFYLRSPDAPPKAG